MIEFFDEPEPLVQREVEGGYRGELRPDQQTLLRRPPLRVAQDQSIAESISEKKVFGRRHGFGGRHVHACPYSGICTGSRSLNSGLKSRSAPVRHLQGRTRNHGSVSDRDRVKTSDGVQQVALAAGAHVLNGVHFFADFPLVEKMRAQGSGQQPRATRNSRMGHPNV